MITYKSTKNLPAAALFNLYKSVGWTDETKNPKKHGALLAKVYANSDLVFSAWDGKTLVGAIRAITDKYAHGCIFGFAVDSLHQNQGIGTKLLAMCVKKYPKIQWNGAAESKQLAVFGEQGFVTSNNVYLSKGACPV